MELAPPKKATLVLPQYELASKCYDSLSTNPSSWRIRVWLPSREGVLSGFRPS